MMDGRGPPRRGVREVCTETEVIGAAVVTDDVSLRRWYRELPRLPHQRAPDGNTWKLSLSLSLEFGRGLSLAGQLHVKGIYHRAEDEPIDRFKQAERTVERRLYHYSTRCYGAWNK